MHGERPALGLDRAPPARRRRVDLEVGDRRIALRHVGVRGAVVAERALAHDQVARVDAGLERAGAAHPDERGDPDARELLDGDGGRGAAHAGRGGSDLAALVRADHRAVLALVRDLADIGQVLGDERDAERVAGQERDRADLSGRDADVELANTEPDLALVEGRVAHSGVGLLVVRACPPPPAAMLRPTTPARMTIVTM